LYLKIGSMIWTSLAVITSTGSVMYMSQRSAVAPLAELGGGVAVLGPSDMLQLVEKLVCRVVMPGTFVLIPEEHRRAEAEYFSNLPACKQIMMAQSLRKL